MSRRATALAPAKVNLALRVLYMRPDGYHEIETLFQAIDLSDDVEVELRGDRVALEVLGADLGPMEHNLAFRAATAFLSEAAPDQGALVRLRKRVPHGAGLGGGSSDAAAVLRCLSALIGRVSSTRLHEVAAGLGSDVAFFLGESPLARGRGRGELLEALPALPPADLVLVSPPVHVATAAAYAALAAKRGGTTRASGSGGSLKLASWTDLGAVVHNDLEAVVAAEHAEIDQALTALRGAGATVVSMTGSGSTCFGLFADATRAEAAAYAIAGELGWACRAVRTLHSIPEPVLGP